MFSIGGLIDLVIGAVAASAGWWLYVRGLKGVISDLTDAKNDAQKAADAAKSAVKGS